MRHHQNENPVQEPPVLPNGEEANPPDAPVPPNAPEVRTPPSPPLMKGITCCAVVVVAVLVMGYYTYTDFPSFVPMHRASNDDHHQVMLYFTDNFPVEKWEKLVQSLRNAAVTNGAEFSFSHGPDLLWRTQSTSSARLLPLAESTIDEETFIQLGRTIDALPNHVVVIIIGPRPPKMTRNYRTLCVDLETVDEEAVLAEINILAQSPPTVESFRMAPGDVTVTPPVSGNRTVTAEICFSSSAQDSYGETLIISVVNEQREPMTPPGLTAVVAREFCVSTQLKFPANIIDWPLQMTVQAGDAGVLSSKWNLNMDLFDRVLWEAPQLRRPQGRQVILLGQPGVGKTALADIMESIWTKVFKGHTMSIVHETDTLAFEERQVQGKRFRIVDTVGVDTKAYQPGVCRDISDGLYGLGSYFDGTNLVPVAGDGSIPDLVVVVLNGNAPNVTNLEEILSCLQEASLTVARRRNRQNLVIVFTQGYEGDSTWLTEKGIIVSEYQHYVLYPKGPLITSEDITPDVQLQTIDLMLWLYRMMPHNEISYFTQYKFW